MQAKLERADLSYEVRFKRPMFEQLRNAQPLQSLYDALAENFPVSLTDVAFNPGSMRAQVAGTIISLAEQVQWRSVWINGARCFAGSAQRRIGRSFSDASI